jgi:hypothetical protein
MSSPKPLQSPIPGRTCQGCTMCCKLLEVTELEKPRGVWCAHCDHKRGCAIYAERPDGCRIFHCGYLRIPHLDERWKPSKAKFVVNYEAEKKRVVIHVDPDRPNAWREAPYHAEIRRWAFAAAREKGLCIVWTGDHAVAVLPNRDKDLGTVRGDQILVTTERRTPGGIVYDCLVLEPDDPRLQGEFA